ncbi:hypothetical protein PG592_08590 [Riemerella anatipestifer]|nr:hypothetical protein [Riemerella anatipestifer]WGH49457.1 hypothetical protein CRP2_000016 [Riemerella phage vB_RanS_CRP2]MCO7317279.1 hypothetical protein [Riemerella anatipestifer]MCT6750076.1 hypothetical protein [Riemerella anatipestifer]MCU7545197.1 hypothetical protein [Riemerella anatipestifer]MCW0515816.1 hypothetical protein [Riemerella anatipestifer]
MRKISQRQSEKQKKKQMVLISKKKKKNTLTAKIRAVNRLPNGKYEIINTEVKYKEKNGKVKVL